MYIECVMGHQWVMTPFYSHSIAFVSLSVYVHDVYCLKFPADALKQGRLANVYGRAQWPLLTFCAYTAGGCSHSRMDEELQVDTQTKDVIETDVKKEDVTEETVKQEEQEEEDEEALPHSEFLDVFEEGLALIVQDPLLCDLPIQVTLEEVNSQVALEYGQAMTVRVCKADGEIMPIVVVQSAAVLDLKKAIQRYMELKQQREGGVKHVSWKYVWRTFHLVFNGERLEDDRRKLKDYGIRNRDDVTFMKKPGKK
ncbi:U11/U12 small nuclear ribonucleoprotein 25 kDa protein isoform X1 [Pygocentrus nattereri]|nr:U11/U12 small nuclear ribonucleoprotein 25 kDa protein isoform X1 [Pygocentrus nattereri]XP_037391242.1 U11/U12 small nuclear ribonucleoprotein 25 kDa protein isoform X1 [Pygocentrus nattereri]XP_037391243.1 U11/U12 small nuclear ribonucleoprotein 25 kDa protein isoform X1 [Pygocentrus nattereri]